MRDVYILRSGLSAYIVKLSIIAQSAIQFTTLMMNPVQEPTALMTTLDTAATCLNN